MPSWNSQYSLGDKASKEVWKWIKQNSATLLLKIQITFANRLGMVFETFENFDAPAKWRKYCWRNSGIGIRFDSGIGDETPSEGEMDEADEDLNEGMNTIELCKTVRFLNLLVLLWCLIYWYKYFHHMYTLYNELW